MMIIFCFGLGLDCLRWEDTITAPMIPQAKSCVIFSDCSEPLSGNGLDSIKNGFETHIRK